MTRRSLEGAWKCALRDLLREEAMADKREKKFSQYNSIQPINMLPVVHISTSAITTSSKPESALAKIHPNSNTAQNKGKNSLTHHGS